MELIPDFILDWMDVSTFWTIMLMAHALVAVALLGAISHQAMSVLVPVRQAAGGGIITRFRAVQGAGYAAAVCVLWVVQFLLGCWIYTKYRMYVRIPIEAQGYWKTLGVFDLKEHVATLGLFLLPIYWYFWKNTGNPEYASPRRWLTVLMAAMVWYLFLVGHFLNNVRGFGS